jgi:hypothetical protein
MVSGVHAANPLRGCFLASVRRLAGLDHDNYVVGSSGDSAEMATELADLVVAGIKRASLACDYGEGREPTSKPADLVTRRRLPITGLDRKGREAGGRWRTLGRHSLSDINSSCLSISTTAAQ